MQNQREVNVLWKILLQCKGKQHVDPHVGGWGGGGIYWAVSKEIGLEVNCEKTKWRMSIHRENNAVYNNRTNTKYFENMMTFEYSGTKLSN